MAYDGDIRELVASTLSDRNVDAYTAIDGLLKLQPGWDGYDGRAPPVEAVTQAKVFIATMPTDVPGPEIEPSGDGEINLVWRSAVVYLEIGFCGDQQFSFFGKTRTTPEQRFFGDVPISANRLPLALHWLMKQVTNGVPVRDTVAEPAPLAWAS